MIITFLIQFLIYNCTVSNFLTCVPAIFYSWVAYTIIPYNVLQQGALTLLQEMEDVGIERDTTSYNNTMSACLGGSRWSEALSVYRRMHTNGTEKDVLTYRLAIRAHLGVGDWEGAVRLIAEARAQRLTIDVATYTDTMGACVRAAAAAVGKIRRQTDGEWALSVARL
jgi:pentatricopeptide repeat protein